MTEKRYIEGVKGFDDYDVWDNESEQGLSHTEVVDLLNEQDKRIKELEEKNKDKHFFKIVDDYLIEYDGDYFDLHKPSDIRSLIINVNIMI